MERRKANEGCVIGVDFGTDSVRSLIVDAATGEEIAGGVHHYARWREGRYCDPARNQFRQHPLDYLEGLTRSVRAALAEAPARTAEKIRGISVDTTGSTPVAVDREGAPLALHDDLAENPNAMFVLWKDHTAVAEAEEINHHARSWHHAQSWGGPGGGEDYTRYAGGVYSSEWFWAKLLHVLRTDGAIRERAFSWVEHCDWISAALTGQTDVRAVKRSRCAAGHKAMWHERFGGLPSEEFLARLDPLLAGWRARLYTQTYTSDVSAGTLSREWAGKLGLREDVAVGVGAFDAHMGAVGAQIEPYVLCKIIGTSTCDVLVAPLEEMNGNPVRGICGQVDGSVIPGLLGMEAGQSAFGDVYAWFRDLLLWPLGLLDEAAKNEITEAVSSRIIPELSLQARQIPAGASEILALDWLNGRRTPDANQLLKGAITGLSLGSDAPRVFRALVEATAFGARRIVDCFTSQGVPVKGVIALGGVAKRSPFVMQTLADVLEAPIKVARSEQACALGAAMFAAVCAGLHATAQEAQRAMGQGFEVQYQPNRENAAKYRMLYDRYNQLGAFVEGSLAD